MARNSFGVMTGGPRGGLSQEDLDYIYGRDGATGGDPSYRISPVESRPLPDLTPRPQLRGTIDETAPALRGTLGPQDSMGGRDTAIQGPTRSGGPIRTSFGEIPRGKGFAQAIYERALGTGLTDTQARLVASQAALESRNGQSGLSRRDNNFFGIKAGSSWKGERASWGTGEQDASGRGYRMQSDFRKYASPDDSFADYARLVQRRWPEAWNAGSIRDAAAGLRFGQSGGYATDQAYGSKLENISRGLKPPGTPGPYNPDGIRPPRDIPNPNGYANTVSNRSNMAPPESVKDMLVGGGDLRSRPLPGPAQNYEFRQPDRPMQTPQQMRPQDFLVPLQQPAQSNAFTSMTGNGGGGSFLESLFSGDFGGGGGGGSFWDM